MNPRNQLLRATRVTLLLAMMHLLVCCLSAQPPDFTPPTPLLRALLYNDAAVAKRLLAAGADPNEGQFAGFPPVFFAIVHKNVDLFQMMKEKGADLKARDGSGATTLMWAAFNENDDTELVEALLKLGVDPNAQDKNGETALTWALRRAHPRTAALLRNAGASDQAMIKKAAEKSLSLLQKSGAQFYRVSGCTSCHHQSLPQMALAVAREHKLSFDEQAAREQTKTVALGLEIVKRVTDAHKTAPDPSISISYALAGLGAEHYPPDAVTDAMANVISNEQLPDGSFRTIPARPPLESSTFTATALSLRALQLYGNGNRDNHPGPRITSALEWLRKATPRTTEDRVMQLLGMSWGKASPEELRDRGRRLLAEQTPSGGWAQLPGLESDAYATGQALVALNQSGQLSASDPAYQRGIAFLLRTQLADGSWLVYTRTFPVQPPKDSGFPHGKHQWISASGTSWAAMALSLAVTPVVEDRGAPASNQPD